MESAGSSLRSYLDVIRRQWWLVALVPAVTVALVLVYVLAQKPVHRASLTLVVGEAREDSAPVLGTDSLIRTLVNLMESDLVVRSVIEDLSLNISNDGFRDKLSVDVLPATSVLEVNYDSTDPELALSVVTRLNDVFTREIDEALGVQSENPLARVSPDSFNLVVRTFDAPHLEAATLDQGGAAIVVFAGIASLALGILLAVGRDALNSRVRAPEDAEDWFNAPVVSTLPKARSRDLPPGVGVTGSRTRREHRRAQVFDLLRARVQFAGMGDAGPTILVTSSGPNVNKSMVAANLGAALARAGKNVVCVDADVRRPSLHERLGIENNAAGLADVIEGRVDLDDVIVRIDLTQPSTNGAEPTKAKGRLEVVPAGAAPLPVADLLTPEAVKALTEKLKRRADYVVFDAPPILAAELFPLALQSDNVLVVARRGKTTKNQARAARTTLERLGIDEIGIVLTDVPHNDFDATAY